MAEINRPQRHRPVHGVHIALDEPTIVWLTVCTKNRTPWLAHPDAHARLVAAWREAGAWLVGRYVLMPDHLHLFCAPYDLTITLEAWVRYWKSLFTRAAAQVAWRWQPGHWDTRLRRSESYTDKWNYAVQNPVRAGLVVRAEDWPWQGELNVLRW